MSELKFTKGPWYHYHGIDYENYHYHNVVDGEDILLASVWNRDDEENAANAALIAAAPDMYKMLNRFATYFKERGFNTPRTCALPTPEEVCDLIDRIDGKEIVI